MDAINTHIPIHFPIDDPEKLAILAAEFQAKSRGQCWSGQVGAVDGVHIAMGKPPKKVPNPRRYFVARKDEFALLVMCTCDAKRRFLAYDISQASTTHDSLAWAASSLGRAVGAGELPLPFFINGDNAFTQTASMMMPAGTAALDDYDFVQSSSRMPIECAFGILVRRWGVLWRPLLCRFDRRAALVGALIRLHNVCIDWGVTERELEMINGLGKVQPGRWAKVPIFDRYGRPVRMLDTTGLKASDVSNVAYSADRFKRRGELVAAVREAGIVRPPLPAGVAKKRKTRK